MPPEGVSDGVIPLAQDVMKTHGVGSEGSGPFASAQSVGRSVQAGSGAIDPDGPIWHGDAFRPDAWAKVADGDPLPDAPVVLSKTQWLAERGRLGGRRAPLSLRLEPGEALDDIAADLLRFAMIALSFPKFADGRAFSTATLLRQKYRFAGELRAVGNVLSDQI